MKQPQVRRATIEDLPQLREMWAKAQLSPEVLEKRLTEFQVLESDSATLLGAIGMQIAGQQGLIHHEVLTQPENADAGRALLWERLQAIARNHGLVRLWTAEEAPCWKQAGFAAPAPEVLPKLPGLFALPPEKALTLQLKEEVPTAPSLDHEFALFQQAQKEETSRMMRQAKVLKTVALLVSLLVALLIVAAVIVMINARSQVDPGMAPSTEEPGQPPS